MNFNNDTINIQEVIIKGKEVNFDPPGYKKALIDSSILTYKSHSSISEILSENSYIFVKSYGMGGTATPSLRGTGPGHTLVSWNNININHPMLGQSDLSLINVGLIDDIQIYYGGGSMPISNGGIGGIVNLETKPVWKKETQLLISPAFGSFGQYSGLVKVRIGNTNFQSVTKAFYHSSDNDFRFLNTEVSAEPVWQKRNNSQVSQGGFIQEFYYRKSNNVASARIWYESTQRNLPPSMLTQQVKGSETQFDESLRTMLNYDFSHSNSKYYITTAWMHNRLDYSNTLASINSSNLSETFVFKSGMESWIGSFTMLKISVTDELNYVISNNYSKNNTRNTTSLTASIERNAGNRLGATILFREILNDKSLLIPDFSAGLQFRLIDEKDYYLKANISRNSKIPTMNDIFWIPGGNPNLKNEYAFIYELTYDMNQQISSSANLKYDVSLYKNRINDMIAWQPGEYSYWTPDNIKSVNSSGIESSISFNYRFNKLLTRLSALYSYTKATTAKSHVENDISLGKQLMYMPANKASGSISINYRIFYSSWLISMTGKRYTTVDNSRFLPGYMLNNIITGIKINRKSNTYDINFHIDNLFGVDYQTIAYYPLPGRSYSVKFLIQILK